MHLAAPVLDLTESNLAEPDYSVQCVTDLDEIEQTLAGMVEAFDTNYIVGVREEPRLTEQQFGNFQNLATIVESKAERARFGRFYYRCGAVWCGRGAYL